MYLGFLTARAVSDENALTGTKLGRAVQTRFGLDETTLDQLGLVASIVINIFVVSLGIPIILLSLGIPMERNVGLVPNNRYRLSDWLG